MYQEQLETIENPLDVDILVTNILPFPYQVGDKTKMFYLPEKQILIERWTSFQICLLRILDNKKITYVV
ncbi:hypothetical protein SNF32_14095 [Enterococcus mundtii]|nr:hypothetical protein [Enterococcus mundtii]